jgi:hypothetical protein
MRIFSTTQPPSPRQNVADHYGEWYTWADEFRTFMAEVSEPLRRLPEPRLVNLAAGATEFDYTFSIPLSELAETPFRTRLIEAADSLHRMEQPRRIMFLTDMLEPNLDGASLHRLLCSLREAMVHLTGDRWAALHTPTKRVGPDAGEFPLHADLYAPFLLWNLFEEVPADSSGASLFLSVDEFLELLPSVRGISADVRVQMEACLRDNHRDRDGFQEFYRLLYGGVVGPRHQQNDWTRELRQVMLARSLHIKLEYGQGYLLHDRRWLHGRTAPTGGVSQRRLHRLVFKNVSTAHGEP